MHIRITKQKKTAPAWKGRATASSQMKPGQETGAPSGPGFAYNPDSRLGDTILDPFCGSGTTGAVAIQEGRDFIGIDINPKYCTMSEQRIKEVRT